jgi:hypothetical protein
MFNEEVNVVRNVRSYPLIDRVTKGGELDHDGFPLIPRDARPIDF